MAEADVGYEPAGAPPTEPPAVPLSPAVDDRWSQTEHSRVQHFRAVLLDRYWTVLVLVVLVVIFAFTSTGFFTRVNWVSTSVYASALIPLAIGEMLVMLTGGIDLSMAGNAAFSGMVSALVLNQFAHGGSSTIAVILGCAACVGCGALLGFINGFLVAELGLAPFIVTLGLLEITTGGVNLLNHGLSQAVSSQPLLDFGSNLVGNWVSPLVIVSIGMLLAGSFLLSRTRFGLRTYAIGSNPEAVRRLGVPTKRIVMTLYTLAGACAGIAGLFIIARLSDANTEVDSTNELTAIAAVVIGGTSLFGGSGTILGTVIGVAIVSVLLPGLVLSGLPSFWQTVVTGIVIIGAIVVDQLRARRASSGRKLADLFRLRQRTTQ